MLAAAGVAFIVSLVVVRVIERRAHVLGLIDRPNHRSSHAVPRPRGGGIGILCGVGAGLALAQVSGVALDGATVAILLASLPVAAVGLWDDAWSIPPLPRLGVHVVSAAAVVWACGGLARVPLPPPADLALAGVGPVAAMVWIVAVTNFFNFMDGADGLAGGQAAITFTALAWVLWPMPAAVFALLAAAAAAAFLLRNWAPAKIFLGDVGSGWLGFVLAAMPFAVPSGRRVAVVLLVATSLALFLIDPAVTLVRRWWRGERITASHREHAYQRLFDPRFVHARTVAALLVTSVGLTVLGVTAENSPAFAWAGVGAAGAAGAIEWAAAGARSRRSAIPAGDSADSRRQR